MILRTHSVYKEYCARICASNPTQTSFGVRILLVVDIHLRTTGNPFSPAVGLQRLGMGGWKEFLCVAIGLPRFPI